MRHQHVGAEADQSADRVRLAVQHRLVELTSANLIPARQAQRTLRHAERRRHALRGRQVVAHDRTGRHGGEQLVAAVRVETAGQGIEQGHGACRLCRIGMLLVPAPGVVGDRARVPDQPGGRFELVARNPARRLDGLRRIVAAERGVELERGTTGHLAVRRRDPVFAFQRQARDVRLVAAGSRVVGDQTRLCLVPGEVAARALEAHVARAQQSTVIVAHQQGPVAPGLDERPVVPAVLDHQVGETQCQCAVAARADAQPDIRLGAHSDPARIDHDQLQSTLQRIGDGGCVRQAGEGGVVAPQDQASAVGDVGHRARAAADRDAADAERVLGGKAAPPAAHVDAVEEVRCAERIHQPPHEGRRIADRRGRGGGHAEGNRLRAMLRLDPLQGSGGEVEGFVPRNRHPTGIGVALGTRAAQRTGQALRVIDQLGGGASLGTDRLPRRMRGIGIEANEAPALHRRDRAATRDTQGAMAVNFLRGRMVGHGDRAPLEAFSNW